MESYRLSSFESSCFEGCVRRDTPVLSVLCAVLLCSCCLPAEAGVPSLGVLGVECRRSEHFCACASFGELATTSPLGIPLEVGSRGCRLVHVSSLSKCCQTDFREVGPAHMPGGHAWELPRRTSAVPALVFFVSCLQVSVS